MNRIERMLQELCPEGVEYKKLGDVCEIKGRIGFRGYTRKDLVTENEGAISLSPSNIENGCLHFDHCSYVSWAKYNESPEIMANIGDVVFTKTASVGKTALIKNLPKETTINPQLVLLKNITCNSAFLAYVLQDNRFQSEVQKITGVGSVPNVSQSALQGIEIPIPPLPIQEEIVRILDHFTELTASLQAELQARQEQYEYYRNKLLTFDAGSVTWMKMSEIAKISSGKNRNKSDVGTFPVYGSTSIIAYCENFIYVIPQILIARVGVNAGFVHIAVGRYDVSDNTLIVSIEDRNKYDFKYVYYILSNMRLNKFAKGGGQPLVTATDIKKLLVPIPSLDKQQHIVEILDKFETLVGDFSQGLPAEIAAVQEQYEFYRNKLLTFKRIA